MSFEMSIERSDGEAIPLEAWLAVARTLEALRARTEPLVSRNPRTGKTISVPAAPGTFQMVDPLSEEWVDAIHWSDGRLILEADLFGAHTPERSISDRIAAALGAVIIDPEDEDDFDDEDNV